MKRAVARFIVLLAASLPIGAAVGSAQNPIVEQLRAQWAASRKQLAQIAEAMPAGKYQYQPTAEVRSFGALVAHVAGYNMMWMETVAGVPKPGSPERFDHLKTRPEILKALSDCFDYGDKVLAGLNDQKAMELVPSETRQRPRWVVVEQAIGHAKEHYGNMVTYMRLNGIVPPSTAGAAAPAGGG